MAASGGLSDRPFDKKPSGAPATETFSDDDWFGLGARPAIKQPRKTDDPAIEVGHPGRHPAARSEIVVESAPGIVASGRRAFAQ